MRSQYNIKDELFLTIGKHKKVRKCSLQVKNKMLPELEQKHWMPVWF